jgi:hypothetical protein
MAYGAKKKPKMTHNRPSPEGSWDHDVLLNLEDKTVTSTHAHLAKPTPLLAVGLLHHTKENLEMLKGWRTVAAAVAVAAVGALQTAGWADLVPAPYVGPVMMALGFAMAFLRGITGTKVGAK